MSSDPAPLPETRPDLKILWTRCALFVAVVGVLGSLHLSLSMELKACPLCFYQRAFIMSAAAVLGFGLFLPGVPIAGQTVLALAPACAGFFMAGAHSRLVWVGVMECPTGITGALRAPEESLLIHLLLVLFLLGDLFHRRCYVMQGLGAVLMGLVFCLTCLNATPPSPTPTAPYTTQLDICRKIYREPK